MRKIALLIAAGAALAWTGAAAAPRPGTIQSTTAALEFEYGWAKEAASIAPLERRFRADARQALARAAKDAGEDMKLSKAQKREFHQHSYSWTWESAGQSPRLLSLLASAGFFTGGAHPNSTSKALLWDRRLAHEIPLTHLFLRQSAFANLTRAAFCKALDKERLKRREGEKIGGQFDDCPKFDELAIVLADSGGNGRFDLIRFIAPPYVAGPYAEGDYELELPVTRQLIAAMKPLYRASFEPQRQ